MVVVVMESCGVEDDPSRPVATQLPAQPAYEQQWTRNATAASHCTAAKGIFSSWRNSREAIRGGLGAYKGLFELSSC